MRSHVFYNFPEFDSVRDMLLEEGYEVVSPADMDREQDGFVEPTLLPQSHDWDSPPAGFDFKACVQRDLMAVTECDEIYLLRGWGDSRGAKAEKAVADWLGLPTRYQQ